MYCCQHILQGVGRVCIVDDCGVAFCRTDGFQSSAHAVQGAHCHENVVRFLAEHHCGAIDSEQVAHVELAYELHAHLMVVDVKVHPFEVTLYYSCLEVGHRACGVGLHCRLGVLCHHHTVAVVGVGYCEGCLWKTVEERLLCVAVVLESLVIVEVVACQIGEYSARKGESSYSFLGYGVRRTFHEGVFAACLNHSVEQLVECYRVGSGVVCRHSLVHNVVADGGEQSALVTHLREHII